MGRVFVSGLGVVSPLGVGAARFWEGLLEGRSGVAPVRGFETGDLERHLACEVQGFDVLEHLSEVEAGRSARCAQMAIAAARMAALEAGLSARELAGPRTAVVIGTTMGEANLLGDLENAWIHGGEGKVEASSVARYGTGLLPVQVARALGAEGILQALPAACAAGNYAIGFAADLIRAGRADRVITGATEVIERLQYAGFARLGAMSPDVLRPFDSDRRGLLIGEGAGIMILESEAHLAARGGEALAEVGGYGLACDGHHITRPDPEGRGSNRAMRQAILSSGLDVGSVDFINAHGTGTPTNDPVEAKVIADIFGAAAVPVTSIKSMIGHCMGAASALEAISCVKSIQTGLIPPTIHHESTDPECPVDVVTEVREGRCEVVLNNSLAFGGYDAVLCLSKPGVLPEGAGRG